MHQLSLHYAKGDRQKEQGRIDKTKFSSGGPFLKFFFFGGGRYPTLSYWADIPPYPIKAISSLTSSTDT